LDGVRPRRRELEVVGNRHLTRNAAPLVAFGNLSSDELFSARIGCQVYGVYGVDLGALCIKRGSA
jgi:hypothetical protein